MAVVGRIQVLADKAAELSVLAEFIKNPNLISQLQEEVKKLNSLTAEEEEKVAQARKDLREHAEKVEALTKERLSLEADKKSHTEYMEKTKDEFLAKQASIAIMKDHFDNKKNEQEAKDKTHAEERKKLDAQAAALQKAVDDANIQLVNREAGIKQAEAKNEATRINLEYEKKKLADKLKILTE